MNRRDSLRKRESKLDTVNNEYNIAILEGGIFFYNTDL